MTNFIKRTLPTLMILLSGILMGWAQQYKFDFSGDKKVKSDYIKITPASTYTDETGYGYDFRNIADPADGGACFFSVKVPDGNYKVKVTLGSKKEAGETTVRGESRRLLLNNRPTKKGEFITEEFIVNKRDSVIRYPDGKTEMVRVKANERANLHWDNRLTFEINGEHPVLKSLEIEPAGDVTTLFLCGNSTVVDQGQEPWASWGQMIPAFFNQNVAVANYAESGLAADTFIAQNRLSKLLTQIKPGDYVFVEFGHNDQKQKGPGKGAYYSFAFNMKKFIDEAKAKGAIPVFITPTRRRAYDAAGNLADTHLDFPQATRDIAAREGIGLIELQEMTRDLYNALGQEGSTKLFVHYPANTFKGQTTELKDNTHFNTYGAYEVARCVLEGMKKLGLPFLVNLRQEYTKPFNPSAPDSFESFKWPLSPFEGTVKPDGN